MFYLFPSSRTFSLVKSIYVPCSFCFYFGHLHWTRMKRKNIVTWCEWKCRNAKERYKWGYFGIYTLVYTTIYFRCVTFNWVKSITWLEQSKTSITFIINTFITLILMWNSSFFMYMFFKCFGSMIWYSNTLQILCFHHNLMIGYCRKLH